MSVTILSSQPVVGAVEAMRLRDNFTLAVEAGSTSVILDLTGVQELSGAGLAAVTNIATRGRRNGFSVRVLLPDENSAASCTIDQADLRRFLRPGGVWNSLPTKQTGSADPATGRTGRNSRFMKYLPGQGARTRTGRAAR
ncbi:hypothetical protein JDV09_13435 [Mycobacterium sp. Y57]|uniref:STAS domain-containing protein n=1 Tax=Mycolicibacterium xanthum TaxID=2796469 RepID=UPI001C843F07|nr:STAS domain-containing protein [Mycolicibacterium xanthum]MBX7433104.1 hypothetical protein [Mycolicibacterium xanthum]